MDACNELLHTKAKSYNEVLDKLEMEHHGFNNPYPSIYETIGEYTSYITTTREKQNCLRQHVHNTNVWTYFLAFYDQQG